MNIKYNSKKIQKGDTFIALKTNNDGHKYINDAIKNGATKNSSRIWKLSSRNIISR